MAGGNDRGGQARQAGARNPTRRACRSVTTPTPNFSTCPNSRDKRTTPTCYLLTNRMIDSWTRHRTWGWTIAAFRNAPPLRAPRRHRARDALPGPQIYLRLTLSLVEPTSELIF
ncbi:unnamed protein product, partial [Iphiclides podalirius]